MRLIRPVPGACEDARQRISLALDRKLPELDHIRLERHLEDCDACRSFQTAAVDVTRTIRGSRLEARVLPFALPRRRRVPVHAIQLTAVVAAVALVATVTRLPLTGTPANGTHAFRGAPQRAFVQRGGKLVPARSRDPAAPVAADRIAL